MKIARIFLLISLSAWGSFVYADPKPVGPLLMRFVIQNGCPEALHLARTNYNENPTVRFLTQLVEPSNAGVPVIFAQNMASKATSYYGYTGKFPTISNTFIVYCKSGGNCQVMGGIDGNGTIMINGKRYGSVIIPPKFMPQPAGTVYLQVAPF